MVSNSSLRLKNPGLLWKEILLKRYREQHPIWRISSNQLILFMTNAAAVLLP
jgi:hypothetical protein